MEAGNRLLSISHAAVMLGCSRTKIYDLGKRKALDLVKIGPRSVRVSEESLRRLMRKEDSRKIVDEPVLEKPRRLRVPDAAKYVGITQDKLYRMRAAGEGPAFFKLGDRILYDTRDLDAWMEANRHEPKQAAE
jgi:excisionase family DNA binding protein